MKQSKLCKIKSLVTNQIPELPIGTYCVINRSNKNGVWLTPVMDIQGKPICYHRDYFYYHSEIEEVREYDY